MAAFDPIEFFGIGHGRDVGILDHGMIRRQSSTDLSSAGLPSHAVLNKGTLEWPSFAPVEQSAVARAPSSPLHSFTNITPEDSIFGLTFGLDTSPPPSPNVSNNSSSASSANHPSPLDRYVRSHERHECFAISLAFASNAWHGETAEHFADCVFSLDDPANAKTPSSAKYSHNSKSPMHQYLADVQTHGRLALFLAKDSNRRFQKQNKSSSRELPKIESSISLSGESEAEDGINDMATTEDGDYMVMSAKMSLQLEEMKRERGLGQSRIHKVQQVRKRRNESSQQGHRDKMVKWS